MPEVDLRLPNNLDAEARATAGPADVPATLEIPIAPLKDRVAAQVLDAAICILVFWYASFALADRYGGLAANVQGHEIRLNTLQLAAALFAAAVGLYFIVMEWTAGATAGKMLCLLRVRSADGGRCGFVAALLRNLLRPVDATAAWLLVFLQPRGHRLGDRIADTIVTRPPRRAQPLDNLMLARWEQRARAALIDFVLLFLTGAAYLFLVGSIRLHGGVQVELRGYPLTVLGLVAFFYYVIPQGKYGVTPGKALSRLRVIYRSGAPCDFVAATWRTLFIPLDALPLGLPAFLCARLTPGRQRFGDLVASTVVIVPRRRS